MVLWGSPRRISFHSRRLVPGRFIGERSEIWEMDQRERPMSLTPSSPKMALSPVLSFFSLPFPGTHFSPSSLFHQACDFFPLVLHS